MVEFGFAWAKFKEGFQVVGSSWDKRGRTRILSGATRALDSGVSHFWVGRFEDIVGGGTDVRRRERWLKDANRWTSVRQVRRLREAEAGEA